MPSWHGQTTFTITEHIQLSMRSILPFKLIDCCNTIGDEFCFTNVNYTFGTFQNWCSMFVEASFRPVKCFFIRPLLCIVSQAFSTNLRKPNMKTGICIEVMYIQQYELKFNLLINKG
jgi:hypothetical protein